MDEPAITLASLDEALVSGDGAEVSFRVRGESGDAVRIACAAGDVERMVAFLIGLAQQAAHRRGGVAPRFFGNTDKVTAEPLEASDVGLMRGMETGEVVLVARLFGVDLAFSVTTPQLAALHREIGRVVPRSMLAPDEHDHHHHGHGHHHHGHDHDP